MSFISRYLRGLRLEKASSGLIRTSWWSIVIMFSAKLSITPKLRSICVPRIMSKVGFGAFFFNLTVSGFTLKRLFREKSGNLSLTLPMSVVLKSLLEVPQTRECVLL